MNGKITISRSSSSHGSDCMSIRVKDVTSRVGFVDIEIGMEDFAYALTGLSEMPCAFKLRGVEFVGKTQENKKEWVEIDGSGYIRDEKFRSALTEAVRPLEVDGWNAVTMNGKWDSWSQGDFDYDHKTGKTRCWVSFVRYV